MGRFLDKEKEVLPGPGDYDSAYSHLTMQDRLHKKMAQLVKSSSARSGILEARDFRKDMKNTPGPADYESKEPYD